MPDAQRIIVSNPIDRMKDLSLGNQRAFEVVLPGKFAINNPGTMVSEPCIGSISIAILTTIKQYPSEIVKPTLKGSGILRFLGATVLLARNN